MAEESGAPFPFLYGLLMGLKLGYNKQIHSELRAASWHMEEVSLRLEERIWVCRRNRSERVLSLACSNGMVSKLHGPGDKDRVNSP